MTPKEHLPAYPPNRLTAILLGADAGGSHSAVAIGREDGTVLGRAEGPGAAMRPGGAAASVVVLADRARRAATQAVVALPVVRAVVRAAALGARAGGFRRAPVVGRDGDGRPGRRARAARAERRPRGGSRGAADPARRGGGARGAGPGPRALFPGSGRDPGRPCGGSPVRNLATGRGPPAAARRRPAARPPAGRRGARRRRCQW